MSRVGGSPIKIPSGVTLSLADGIVSAKGAKGELTKPLPPLVEMNIADDEAIVKPMNNTGKSRALWGTARALVNNMVTGVSTGFTKNLTIHGVGYRAAVQGNKLALNLGFSHPVEMEIPSEVSCSVENNTQVNLSSFNKEVLGQFAAEVRAKRPPEPYKGKGVRYEGEQILRKEGKKK
ncbi:MAG: 50S ribosomal protein L6 [Alphaproteobacteria bacterium]|nr:50S ribosomal protein L6 [Alphaproteobacteria bacterium]